MLPCQRCFLRSDAPPLDPLVTFLWSSSDTSADLHSLRFGFFERLVLAGVDVTIGLTGDGSSVNRKKNSVRLTKAISVFTPVGRYFQRKPQSNCLMRVETWMVKVTKD